MKRLPRTVYPIEQGNWAFTNSMGEIEQGGFVSASAAKQAMRKYETRYAPE